MPSLVNVTDFEIPSAPQYNAGAYGMARNVFLGGMVAIGTVLIVSRIGKVL